MASFVPACPTIPSIRPSATRSFFRRPARDRRVSLSQISRTSCSERTTCAGRVERDAVTLGGAGGPACSARGCRSRQAFRRSRSCSRYFGRSCCRRRFACDLNRACRHGREQVFCVRCADGCGGNHFRQRAHRCLGFFLLAIPGRSGLRIYGCNGDGLAVAPPLSGPDPPAYPGRVTIGASSASAVDQDKRRL